jgi:hypothetical protein
MEGWVTKIFELSQAARRTILLVDDDPTVRQILGRFLMLKGFFVVEAEHGQEALAHLRAGCEAAAIVLDLRMPVMDGIAFRRAQRDDPTIAAIPVMCCRSRCGTVPRACGVCGILKTSEIVGTREPTADPFWQLGIASPEGNGKSQSGRWWSQDFDGGGLESHRVVCRPPRHLWRFHMALCPPCLFLLIVR